MADKELINNLKRQESIVNADEIKKLDSYLKNTFQNSALQVRARPKKDDSCEVYIGDEFLGVIYRDEDEDELSYNFSMAILDIDLEN
ncbi:Protein of uncharacterised function (DUF3126) [Candidatus Bartonella washoeensis]|uniref:DUF3126 domain-containing protein n=1 Tax=Candidatus Bartonella washoeensis Sb944nv TaxID=1094563 RepID=J0Q5R1_9HYPH|nr:hypothetical protein MCQ_01392 [Bartonella washoeensis Sb944nv]SPU27611.1 Protein of uncharacterised function (DUF3126) [Bartonella washoeensis]